MQRQRRREQRDVTATTALTRAQRTAAALALVAALGSGCGKQAGDDQAGREASDRPRSEETTTTTILDPDDVVLGPADFPPGWSQDSLGPVDPARPERLDDLASCLGTELLSDDDDVARSPSFDETMTGRVAATVVVTPSPAAAERLMEVVHRPDMPTCLGTVIIDELATAQAMVAEVGLPDMPTPGEPRSSALSFPPTGDDMATARVVIAQTTEDPSGRYQPSVTDLFSDAVFVREGRVVIVAMFRSGASGPFDSTRARDIVQLMVDRVPPEGAGG